MFATKAVLALSLFAMGGAATGTAVYLDARPSAFTHPAPRLARPSVPARLATPRKEVSAEPEASKVVVLDPVSVIVAVPKKRVHAIHATRAVERAGVAPCSGWQSLATGPEGRRVRLLCNPVP